MSKGIFIAATGQHVGKTTLCLGIISGLRKRIARVGFIKPVGQVHILVDGKEAVDKDVVLFKKSFQLDASYTSMSPILFPAGYTRDYLDGKISTDQIREKIASAYQTVQAENDFVVVEGTGHAGVGSIVGMNNADVAALLNLDLVLIASGGLGSAFDELALNREICLSKGVQLRGVILNRVLENKREMILNYFPKALKRWNLPLIGAVPYNAFLSQPSMGDFEFLFKTTLLSGQKHRFRHFQQIKVVDTSLKTYRADENLQSQLLITAATREEIILATLARYWNAKTISGGFELETGLILTGKTAPRAALVEKIQRTTIPTLYTPHSSFKVMQEISSFTAKIQQEDTLQVEKAIQLVEPHIDFDLLMS